MEGETVFAPERLHLATVAVGGMTVGMRRAISEAHRGACRHRGRLVEIALQRRERAPAGSGDFFLDIGRLERHLEKRVERRVGQIARNGERERRLVHRDVDDEARAHPFHHLVDAVGIAPLGAAPEQIGSELREPGLGTRILAGPRRHRETAMEERDAVALYRDEDEPARLLHHGERGQRHVAQRLHAAAASAGNSPGSKVTRLRRCGAKTLRATRRMASPSTAW